MTNTRYPNTPRVAVGGVVMHNHKVLLVLRGQPPAEGKWAIPGGSVKLGETLQAAVAREIFEETGLHVKPGEMIFSFDAIVRDKAGKVEYHYVILDFMAEPLDPHQPLIPGDDARAAGWFAWADIQTLDPPVTETTRTLLEKIWVNINDRP
jgi:ADP-ribose pyrophosphatase